MGGHGGLNILPQKSWHVYNRDNRSKVEADEAKAKEEESKVRERHENEEREYRRQLLLQRVQSGQHAAPHAEACKEELQHDQKRDAPVHINFWSEDEANIKAQHPEVLVRPGVL